LSVHVVAERPENIDLVPSLGSRLGLFDRSRLGFRLRLNVFVDYNLVFRLNDSFSRRRVCAGSAEIGILPCRF
jgi:hypothetical protein